MFTKREEVDNLIDFADKIEHLTDENIAVRVGTIVPLKNSFADEMEIYLYINHESAWFGVYDSYGDFVGRTNSDTLISRNDHHIHPNWVKMNKIVDHVYHRDCDGKFCQSDVEFNCLNARFFF